MYHLERRAAQAARPNTQSRRPAALSPLAERAERLPRPVDGLPSCFDSFLVLVASLLDVAELVLVGLDPLLDLGDPAA